MTILEKISTSIVLCFFALTVLVYPAHALEQPTQMPSMIEWAKAEWKQYNGVMYLRVPIGTGTWCFTRSTDSFVSKSDQWEYVAPSIPASIPASVEQLHVCRDTLPPVIWVVAKNPQATDTPPTRPLKDGTTMINTWRILVGIPCESQTVNVIKAGQEYHWATNSDGMRGITVCIKQ